jgi:hypothetical protein
MPLPTQTDFSAQAERWAPRASSHHAPSRRHDRNVPAQHQPLTVVRSLVHEHNTARAYDDEDGEQSKLIRRLPAGDGASYQHTEPPS